MYFELLSTRRQNFLRETRQPEPVTCTALEFFSGNLTPEAFLMQANIPRFFFLPIRYQVVRWWCSKWSQWWHDPSHQLHLQLQSVCRHLSRSIQLAGRRRPGRGWHDWIFKYWKVACNYFDRPNIDNVVKSVTTLRCGKSAVRLKGLRWNQRQCRATWVLNEVAQHLTIGSNNLPWRDSSIVDYLQLYNVYCILYYHSTTMYFHILCVIFVRNSLMVPWDQL